MYTKAGADDKRGRRIKGGIYASDRVACWRLWKARLWKHWRRNVKAVPPTQERKFTLRECWCDEEVWKREPQERKIKDADRTNIIPKCLFIPQRSNHRLWKRYCVRLDDDEKGKELFLITANTFHFFYPYSNSSPSLFSSPEFL